MRVADSLDKFAPAFVAFQAEIANPEKTANNPFFNKKYVPLNSLLAYVRPVLASHGLSVFQSAGTRDDGFTGVRTMLMHSSGQFVEGDSVHFPISLGNKEASAQGAGSAITYACRYSLCAALGIAGDDDDGNTATHGHTRPNVDKEYPRAETRQGPPPQRQRGVNKPATDCPPGDYAARVSSGKDAKDDTLIVLEMEVTEGTHAGMILALFIKKAEGKGLNYAVAKAEALLGRNIGSDEFFGLLAADFAGTSGWITIGNNKQFPIDSVHAKKPDRGGDFTDQDF